MKPEEIFHGFDAEKQAMYEDFLVEYGVNKKVIDEVKDKTNNWPKKQWIKNKHDNDMLYAEFTSAINEKLSPSSPEVQAFVKKHYELTKQFWTPNKESYIGLSQLYGSHPDFVKFYDKIHPKLLTFLVEAMKIFAEHELR